MNDNNDFEIKYNTLVHFKNNESKIFNVITSPAYINGEIYVAVKQIYPKEGGTVSFIVEKNLLTECEVVKSSTQPVGGKYLLIPKEVDLKDKEKEDEEMYVAAEKIDEHTLQAKNPMKFGGKYILFMSDLDVVKLSDD